MNLGPPTCVVRGVKTLIAKVRYLRVVGFAVGGVVVAGAVVLVTASAAGLNVGPRASSPPSTQTETASIPLKAGGSAVCNAFIVFEQHPTSGRWAT